MTAETLPRMDHKDEQGTGPPVDPALAEAVRAARQGEPRAFETLMIATERRVARLAWRILTDAAEVEDALQETYLRVFRYLHRYDETRDFLGWVFTIAVNVCRDLERRRRGRWRIFRPLEDATTMAITPRAEATASRNEEIALLERAISTLSGRQRIALILRDVEQLETTEVAAILGCKPVTVRVHVNAARAKIRRVIARWQVEESR